jgi:DNA-binding MarR family transcriptional regulator
MNSVDLASESLSVERLEKSLRTLSDVYRKHQDYIKTKYRISALEMEIIQLVVLDGRKKMKEIGQHFNVKLSTLTSIIDKIERQRLVKRVNSQKDRRVVFLEVTKKGQRLYESYSQYLHVIAQMMRRSMDDDQFLALVQGLETMTELVVPESETAEETATMPTA